MMSGKWNRFTQNHKFGTEAMVVTFPADIRTDLKFLFLSICIYFVSCSTNIFADIFKKNFKFQKERHFLFVIEIFRNYEDEQFS